MRVTEAELVRWGKRIGESVEPPFFLSLRGGLGAGKSVLARAVARGAGVSVPMPSPTFNLLFKYEGRRGLSLVHIDLYRIADPEELWELGWTDLIAEADVVLLEWPERAGDHLPPDRWEVEIELILGMAEVREVSVTRVGSPPFLPGFPMVLSDGRGQLG